jgi:dsRNA-specific ribonuclease
MFRVECKIEELECITTAEGRSRRKAEQAAAELAIEEVSKKIAS